MLLDHDIDVSAVRQWCVSNGIPTAAINGIVYRGRIRHYEAVMSEEESVLFRFRWDEKTRTVDNDAGPVDGNNVVPFKSPCVRTL